MIYSILSVETDHLDRETAEERKIAFEYPMFFLPLTLSLGKLGCVFSR